MTHPAPYSESVLAEIGTAVAGEAARIGRNPRLLDPFAGIGRIHRLADAGVADTVGIELEPEWAKQDARTQIGDATNLSAEWTATFDIVATSPCYGNRLADHHNAQEVCQKCGGNGCDKCGGSGHRQYKRITYKHALGRDLSDNNAGAMQWGAEYKLLHVRAWHEVERAIKPGGLFLLNISSHFRRKQYAPVAEWHLSTLLGDGYWELRQVKRIATPRMGYGQNRGVRVDGELLIEMRKL